MDISGQSSLLSGKKLNLKRSLKRPCREPRGISVGNLLKRVWGLDEEEGVGREMGCRCPVGGRSVEGLLALLGLTTS